MLGLIAPIQGDDIFRQFLNEFGMMQNNITPEHHPAAPRGDFAMNLFQKLKINPPFASQLAQLFAATAAQVPGFIATDIKTAAGEMRQQFIVKLAQKRERAGMIRRQCRRIAQELAPGPLVRLVDLGQFPQGRMLQPIAQMSKGILIWNQIDPKLPASGVKR